LPGALRVTEEAPVQGQQNFEPVNRFGEFARHPVPQSCGGEDAASIA